MNFVRTASDLPDQKKKEKPGMVGSEGNWSSVAGYRGIGRKKATRRDDTSNILRRDEITGWYVSLGEIFFSTECVCVCVYVRAREILSVCMCVCARALAFK